MTQQKGIVICLSCKNPIERSFNVLNEYRDVLTFWNCLNEDCPRYGLASLEYEIKVSSKVEELIAEIEAAYDGEELLYRDWLRIKEKFVK